MAEDQIYKKGLKMAIRIIEGKIGSGKTYYAVNHVFRSWYKWCDVNDEWIPKNSELEIKVYTNIKKMKLGHDLNLAINEAGGLNPFFTVEYQERFCENLNVIYIIDEAQSHDLFHRTYKDRHVFTFFQTSRHMGIDIYLITQDTQCLAKELRSLAEYHIVAVQRTKTIGNIFTTNIIIYFSTALLIFSASFSIIDLYKLNTLLSFFIRFVL